MYAADILENESKLEICDWCKDEFPEFMLILDRVGGVACFRCISEVEELTKSTYMEE